MSGFRPLSHESKQVGKLIKASKKKDTWTFELKGNTYVVEYFSSLRGNRKLFVNGSLLQVEINRTTPWECKFKLAGETVSIWRSMIASDLFIGEESFTQVYRLHYEEAEVQRIPWDEVIAAEEDDTAVKVKYESRHTQQSKPRLSLPAHPTVSHVDIKPTSRNPHAEIPVDIFNQSIDSSYNPTPSAPLASVDTNQWSYQQPQVTGYPWAQPIYESHNPFAMYQSFQGQNSYMRR